MAPTWTTGLLDVCGGPDAGVNCCVQHCCCGPCVWADALRRAGVRNGSLFALLLLCGGANSALDETSSFFARRELAAKYGIAEDAAATAAIACCCAPCARVQEVSTVMARENLRYGCAGLVPAAPAPTAVSRA